MLSKINTINPNAITYNTEELGFTILGGIRLEGLERLRVTIKIEVVNRKFALYLNNDVLANLAIRHNLDLYNDVQVEKLIRKTAERLEVGVSEIARAMHEITAQLETYRLEQLKQLEEQQPQQEIKILTDAERKRAIKFLEQKRLLQRTNEVIGASGVIGEEQNRLLMFLIFTSRKRQYPLHCISLGSSGAGKSHLQEKVAELMPEEDKLEITTLSDNALYYFGQQELKHKLILIEDMDGAEQVLYPIRELQSKRCITKTVTTKDAKGATKTIHLKVEGPVCVAGCTTKEKVYEDNANRSFLIYIDESNAQDEKIMQYQRKKSAGTINSEEEQEAKAFMQNVQRVLEPITIRNPYAEQLLIPTEVFKPRRTHAHYLAFIEAVTFYHQYQREQKTDKDTGEMYIETTLEDIGEANRLMKEVLLHKADDLSGAARNYFEQLKKHLRDNKQSVFTNRDIRRALRLAATTIRRYQQELLQQGFIEVQKGAMKKSYLYTVTSFEDYTTLRQNITTVLDKIHRELSLKPVRKATTTKNRSGAMERKPRKALSKIA